MAITPFTNIPSRDQDSATFVPRANDFLGRQLPRFVTEANAMAEEMNDDVATVAQAAADARAAADMAGQAVEGLDNFRGLWSALTGPLAPPASVRHNSRFWILTSPLPNVALSEPGVDVTKWQPVQRGAIVTAASVAAQPGDDIVSTAATAVIVTLPAGPSAGDTIKLVRRGGGLVTVNRNGSTIVERAEDFIMDRRHWKVAFTFADGTWTTSLEGLTA